ncbi:zygotic DNA replication licensing factor mcm3-like [Argopecten irradians]|uniref:zygotic DNA replication licensing factor mcm3-like n=1 Tax=Argopecten irradians TaxID=31199 RepID=UPI003710D93E
MTTEIDQRLIEIQREYLDFLDDGEDQGIYQQKVRDMITNNNVRLNVNINDLRKKNQKRAQGLLNDAFEELIAFQRALKEFVASADPIYSKQNDEFFVGFEGSFGAKHVTPRTLTSRYLGNMVCVEGIVTKCSLIRPKVVRSVHYCPTTKKTMERRYTDMTSLSAYPSSAAYPTKDEDGNLLETEYGLSVYKDHQTFSIQEMPEKAPAGQLPRSIDIVADNDLVDCCKPGDRIQVIGMYRCLPGKKNGFTTGTFRTIMIANNVQLLSKEMAPMFSADDVAKIKKFSRQKHTDVFEVLGRSLAPSIHGHEYIKKAVLCLLLGGNEKVLANGTRIRGDINVLLIGDPSVAKSQMLRYVLHTAPRAIPTTGRGSSGVGLTAAVTTDQESGERRLEAGAMVLADRGVVCIDEFDKMSDMDRTAIHEVMEQGRVTIAKAGIHAKLNARCSVLAAANPVYGRYDQYKTPMENIGLQDSLLSRFDLLFIVLDKMDPELDRSISEHVLRMHRYRMAGEQDGDALPLGSSVEPLTLANPYGDPDLEAREAGDKEENKPHHHLTQTKHDPSAKYLVNSVIINFLSFCSHRIVSMQFMRKYIHVAKALKPSLTREAADLLADEYAKLRNQDNFQGDNIARTQPVTARALETMIRLSTAHAKARLSKTVDLEDAQACVELVHYAFFKKVLEKTKKRRKGDDTDESSQDEAADEVDGEVPTKKKQKKTKEMRAKRPVRQEGDEGYDPYDFDHSEASEDDSGVVERKPRKKRTKSQDSETAMDTEPSSQKKDKVDEKKMKTFRAALFNLFKAEHAQSVSLDKVKAHVAKEFTEGDFSEDNVFSALEQMMDANQVMLADDVVFLI